ncbi:MAG: sensor histidine kinase [Rhodanobacteraceae bacterium]|jgi:signal transduction histidine kinase|nr:sensor histidine kinase [Rhodanobacteraceae bacterium]MBL0041373.1 sensor histidine kinase [Xanthomonadales bacterium]MBP6077415.1 sensor histidine kinase [Xanthomonadales bacterium]
MALTRFDHGNWLRYAGLFTYACVGVPLLRETAALAEEVDVLVWLLHGTVPDGIGVDEPRDLAGWWLAYVAFGLSYWALTKDLSRARPRALRVPLLIIMNLAAIAISWFSQSGLSGILLLVMAGVLPWLLAPRMAVVWAIMQNLSLLPVFVGLRDLTGEPLYGWFDAILQSLLYVGFSSFTFVTSMVARGQAEAREEQRRLNSELRATRALLAESTRIAERVRIARELHDLVGHHLTALTLNLEVASHLVDGNAKDKVRQAQSVAKLLLSDVREVVGQMRDEAEIDLGSALRSLIEGVPTPKVVMDLPDDFRVEDARRAHVLLRCTQEILTNTIRHARAETLWLRFAREADGALTLRSRDDGVGADAVAAGNGLSGMRERLNEFGGSLDIDTAPGRGFALAATLPMETKP